MTDLQAGDPATDAIHANPAKHVQAHGNLLHADATNSSATNSTALFFVQMQIPILLPLHIAQV